MKPINLLICAAGLLLAAGLFFYKTGAAKPTSITEIAALRQEVAALRDEVNQLRHDHEQARKNVGEANLGFNADGSPATAADVMAELKTMRTQQALAQSELASNLFDINLDRGSDAWARGDFKKAYKLLKPLADSGQPIAQHRLGVMYALGQGMDKDMGKAIDLFVKAADQGQGESQHSLGLRLLWGDGVDKDPEKAAAYFTEAANQGIPDSATWLADMYWNGTGVQQDPVEGYKWMILAGNKFNINHRNGVTMDQFAAKLTPDQLAEAQQRAKNFVPQRTGPEDF